MVLPNNCAGLLCDGNRQTTKQPLAMAAGIIDHCRQARALLAFHGTPPRWTLP
jgi:hypothetical protein